MPVTFASSVPEDSSALILPLGKGKPLDTATKELSADAANLVKRAAEASRFEGDLGSIVEIFDETKHGTRRIVIVGAGNGDDTESLQKAGGAAMAKLLTSGETALAFDARTSGEKDAGSRMAFGALQRSWRLDSYRTKAPAKTKPTVEEIAVVANDAEAKRWDHFQALYAGIALARELVTEPPNIIHPQGFVERCRPLSELGVEIEVLDRDEMTELGMGALLGVAQGSIREPKLLVMRWDGTGGAQKNPVAFVGKGVTFDTGGISLKPGPGMEDMKFDMGGAAAVAGAMCALAGRKAKAHVVGVCGLVENMPGSNAQRPSDIVTTMSGQTVEVLNTDAEGRLVLCDAMHWTQEKYSPEVMVDLATLTGAMIIALGHEHGGCFSNDDGLADQLLAAGTGSGDKLWRMPLGKPYDKLIDSPIADIKNVGPREAGSITAAQFLQRFVKDGVKWAHLDIAGTVWMKSASNLWDKGATGYGVRLLDRFIADNFEG
ncbi:leucyl aminopeptidase [Parasphingopyxis algicola]|uniref:leucyl aminopeptidase n=1 Tax=Parasphingopyxis algicola TaxID=2026624 RepID=UPI0015A4D808|nr:leucyl aminopeptidase [Parasphingopyxis algicola]QLC26777.1 leucyl aminopeptidase [Parasphingopyxis algicola]